MPPSLGRCADLYHDVRELRLEMDKQIAAVKAREVEIREHIIGNLAKSRDGGGDSGAAGLRFRAQVVDKDVFKLASGDGWQRFTRWVRESDRFDLLQKRLSEKAVQALVAEGMDVPGVEHMLAPDVSITRI
jgi:hypothetical protein